MNELPFVCPRSAGYGRKVSSYSKWLKAKVDFCPFCGPGAPFCAAGDAITDFAEGGPFEYPSFAILNVNLDFNFRTSTPVPSQSSNAICKSRYNHSKD